MKQSNQRKLTKSEKRKLQQGKIKIELLAEVLYSINKLAKRINLTSLERNTPSLKSDLLDQLLYAKQELLKLFFNPKEIHMIKNKPYLYYQPTILAGFHIPYYEENSNFKSLKKYKVDRENNTPKLKATKIIDLELCMRIFKIRETLTLV